MSLIFREKYGVVESWSDVAKNSDEVSALCASVPDGASLAQQQFKDESDINIIVDRYMTKGVLPQVEMPPPVEAFADAFDFQESMNLIVAGQRSFAAMDASVRNRFNNDAAAFVAFCSQRDADGKLTHLDEMRKMNLAVPAPVIEEPKPMKVEVVNPGG